MTDQLDHMGRLKDAVCNDCGSYKVCPPDELGGAYCSDCGSGDVEVVPSLTNDELLAIMQETLNAQETES